jgi:hypothetical protein
MKICDYCGKQNPDDALYCSGCAFRFNKSENVYNTPYGSYTSQPGGFPEYPGGPPHAMGRNSSGDPSKNWAAILSLIFGILSVVCFITLFFGLLFSVLGIVFGIVGLKSSQSGLAIAGIVTGSLGLVFSIIMGIAFFAALSNPDFSDPNMDQYRDFLEEYLESYDNLKLT